MEAQIQLQGHDAQVIIIIIIIIIVIPCCKSAHG
jgi:hypothetical protein